MKKISLAIMDDDKAYGCALSKALALTNNEFEVYLSPSISDLDQFDLILINEKGMSSLPEPVLKKTVVLTDMKCSILWDKPPKEKFVLYKYDCITILTAALHLYYATMYGCVNPFLVFEKQPFVVGIFSGSGGVGITSVSIALSRELADKKRKKVLFLSLEEIESSSLYFRFPKNHPFMGDYLYYLFSNDQKRNAATFYSTFQYRDSYGVELFYPSFSENELCTLSITEISIFIESISMIGNYDYIVLDVGNHFSNEMAYWLEHCNLCILLGNDTLLSDKKNKKRLERLQSQYRFDKTSFLECCISKDEETFVEIDNIIEIHSNYGFGSEVKALANRVKHANANQRNHKRNNGCSSLSDQCKDRTDYGW
ncbi:hypothetical protein [Anaerovorax sp. IOR16]|uniref:hypothetical protein n=1 Tax=Anaerovorax sp. IOR16 TaxID=2773458 RepID=UPI0019D0D611|nr:hypothetical protein [Anaerovorax sp. IOR16]